MPSRRCAQAGFQITTGSLPACLALVLPDERRRARPFRDVRVRQALNYCVDRDGLVQLLNGTAEPSVGWLKPSDPAFGTPAEPLPLRRRARARACWPKPASTPQRPLRFKVMISTTGSGQMLPLPMNEFLQQNLREACGVKVDFEVTEWSNLLVATRAPAECAGGGECAVAQRRPRRPRTRR